MRHRITNLNTGLGNPLPELLDNKGKIPPKIKEMLKKATELYFKKWGGCDYSVEETGIKFGIEPAYQYENLKIIKIEKTKENSYIQTGRAFGSYGSGIRSTRKYYGEYEKCCKFTKFIDKWHSKLF